MTEITRHHAERINRAHEAAQAAARSAVEHALEAGRLLLEVKAGMEHGQLGDWIAEHCRFSGRTAQSYMRLARELPKLDEAKAQRVADLPFRDALKALSKPKPLVDLGDIPPADYARATEAQGMLRRYATFCEQHPPERIAKAYHPHEVAALRAHVAKVQSWIGQFSEALPGQDDASDSTDDDQEPETLAECASKADALLDRQSRHEQELRAVLFTAWRHKFGEKKAPFLRWLKDSKLPDRVYSNTRRCDVHVGELIAQWRRCGKP